MISLLSDKHKLIKSYCWQQKCHVAINQPCPFLWQNWVHCLVIPCSSALHAVTEVQPHFWRHRGDVSKDRNLRIEGCLFRGAVERWGDLDLWITVAGISQCAKAHGSGDKDDGEDNLSNETLPVPARVVEPLNEDGHDLLQ